MKTTYKCKDNDIILQFHYEDNKVDEVWVKIKGETCWTVVGYKDLLKGLKKAKKKLTLKL